MRTIFSTLCAVCLIVACGPALAAAVTGSVFGPGGQPVAGAHVRIYWHSRTGFQTALQETTSDGGDFFVDGPSGDIQAGYCVIAAKGLSVGGGRILVDGVNHYQLTLPAAMSGTVVDGDRKPVSGATVQITYIETGQNETRSNIRVDMPGEVGFTSRTDSSGRYSFADLPQDSSVTVELNDPRFATVEQFNNKVGAVAQAIVAVPGATIAGKLVYEGGRPAAGVDVFAQATDNGPGWARTKTDAAGTYTLTSLPPGAFNVMVDFGDGSEWVAPADEGVTTVEGSTVNAPEIVASHGAIVSGLVTDAVTGKPVKGAYVGCYGPQRPSSSAAIIGSSTDANGAYSLRVAPGSNKVYLSGTPERYLSQTTSSMTAVAVAEGDTKQVDFQLKPGLSISGTALDSNGKPVPNAAISLSPDKANDYDPDDRPQADTGQDGSFTFNKLSAGSYSLHVSGPWQITSPDQIDVPALTAVSLTLSPLQTSALIGKAVDQAGNPISGIQISFMVMTPVGNGMSMGQTMTEDTDSSGEFTLPDLRPDNQVTATIAKDGYTLVSGGQVTASAGKFTITDIVMAPLNASVTGRVCDDKGAPIAGAWVIAASSGGPDRPILTSADGRFTIAGLAPGDVEICAAKGSLTGSGSLAATVAARTAGDTGRIPSLSVESVPSLSSADAARGYTILRDLYSASANDGYYAAGDEISAIAAYDPDAAIRLLNDTGQPISDMAVMQIIQARSQLSPYDAALWGYPRILSMRDAGARAESAVMLGLMTAHTDPSTALSLYAVAKAAAASATGDQYSQDIVMQLTGLAAALDLPETRSLLDTAIQQCRREPQSGQGESPLELLAMFVAGGNTDLAEEVIEKLPADERAHAQQDILTGVLQINSGGVIQLARKMESGDSSDFNFGKVADAAIGQMGKSDPQGALKLAQSVQSDYSRGIVLADAADFLPMAQAAGLYRQAAALSITQASSRATPAMIAAKAWQRDKALSRALFESALKVCKPTDPMTGRSAQPVADFAFYYARVDPAFSRTLLEKDYASERSGIDQDRSSRMKADALAMAAVDVDRALEMAYAITDVNPRLDAVRKIAQYVLAPAAIRSTMPFDRWTASDTWIPGTPTMW